MDKFLRGDDGLSSLLSSDTLQAQLDSKVHKNDHAAHADTLSTHAATLGEIDTALEGKQDKIVDANKVAFLNTLGVDMDSKQDKIVTANVLSVKSTLGLGSVDNTSDIDKPISSAASVVHTSLEERLAILEELTLDPMRFLKANDGTEFVIQQSAYPRFYMEQRGQLMDVNGMYQDGYENASLLLLESNSQVINSSGIKWTCAYSSPNDDYIFTNVKDSSVQLGLHNSWYVTNSGNTNMNLITNTALTLTSTDARDEYTITQVIGAGLAGAGDTVTLASIHYDKSYETIGGQLVVTGVPMTWFQTLPTDLSYTKFIIRPYNEVVDNIDPFGGQFGSVNLL